MKIFIAVILFFLLCDAQVYRTYIPDNPISIIFLKRDREVRQTHHEDGTIASECEYNENRLDGICKEFYENGVLKSQIEFKKGREDGTALFYYDTGILKMKIEYKRGKLQSITNYDERGKKL